MTSVPRAKLHLSLTDIVCGLTKALATNKSSNELERDFLDRFASECNLNEKFTTLTPSCRIALLFLLEALELPRGSLIALTPLTIPDVVNSIIIAGHRPYFVDLNPQTHNIADHEVDELKKNNVKVALIAHLSGIYSSEVERNIKKMKANGVYVIEDISQAYASQGTKSHAGQLGDAFIGSLCLGKVITAIGGGVLGVNNQDIFNKLTLISQSYYQNRLTPRKDLARYLWQHIKISILTKDIFFNYLTLNILRLAAHFRSTDEIFRSKKRKDDYPYDNPSISRKAFPSRFFYKLRKSQILMALETLKNLRKGITKRNDLKKLYLSSIIRKELLPHALREENQNTLWHFPLNLSSLSYHEIQRQLLLSKVDTCGYLLRDCNTLNCFEAYQRKLPGLEEVSRKTIFIPIHEKFTKKQTLLITKALKNL